MSNPIRKLRVERAWSQEQLAEMAGLSVRTVQRAENGAPSGLETLKSLAAVFEVSLDTLRGEEQAEQPNPTEEMTMQEQTLNSANDAQHADALQTTIRRSVTLALVLGMLTLINYVTMPHFLWVKWPALGFGLAILGMWAAWFSRHENYVDNEPKTLMDMLKTSAIMLGAGAGLTVFNLFMSPAVLWVQWPLFGLGVALIITWTRWLIRNR